MPNKGGYLIVNLQPAHMDFVDFSLGSLWSVVSGLATAEQSHAILDLIEAKWADLVADMPLKICYPSLESQEWQIITSSDPKNTPWSYHNAGSWPTLLWQTWSIAGYLVAQLLLDNPTAATSLITEEDSELINAFSCMINGSPKIAEG
ncbi:hypothetical protein HS088_TW09G00655 [Tripterygium wilfordii]|uniref:Beta-fructofuranosidase n=1 Tax=Tripterygium wilfordii TaxID=458696 RepID=A0A7J7D8G7_TRIWF|nr:hypothetical protein HS088_TW09G00655 [Tripterygium wilfordii]